MCTYPVEKYNPFDIFKYDGSTKWQVISSQSFFKLIKQKNQNFDERNWKTLKNFKPFEVDGWLNEG